MVEYKCNKCGNVVKCKRDIPLEHGKIGLVFYPNKNSSKRCNGKYIEVKV